MHTTSRVTSPAMSPAGEERLAHAVHLNAARDADVERRDACRAALAAWRRARTAGERATALALVVRAAERYGLRPGAARRPGGAP